MENTPGNAIYDMKVAVETGSLRDMPVDQVVEMQYQQFVAMETVLANVLEKRYAQIQKLFAKKYPNGYKGLGETFDELGTPAKREFFVQNVNEIAAAGGLKPIIDDKSFQCLVFIKLFSSTGK